MQTGNYDQGVFSTDRFVVFQNSYWFERLKDKFCIDIVHDVYIHNVSKLFCYEHYSGRITFIDVFKNI